MLQQDPEARVGEGGGPAGPPPRSDRRPRRLTPPAARLVGRDVEARPSGPDPRGGANYRRRSSSSGEAGIGKTALVHAFLGGLAERGSSSRAQCHAGQAGDRRAPARCARRASPRPRRPADGRRTHRAGAELAPPAVARRRRRARGARAQRGRGTTRERMLREPAEALETLSLRHPLVLVLEDLHVADHPTVDLLALIARRPEAARLLLLGTYRPEEARATRHPARARRSARPRRARPRARASAALLRRGGGNPLDPPAGRRAARRARDRLLAERARGNPLFMASLVESWLAEGAISVNGGVRLAVPLERSPPASRERFAPWSRGGSRRSPRRIATCSRRRASRAPSFAPAAAAALELPEREVQERLTVVARLGLLIEPERSSSGPTGPWPAASASPRPLPAGAVRVRPGRAESPRPSADRSAPRGRIRRQGSGDRRAARLSLPEGREPGRALDYLRVAAERAFQRNAYAETIDHVRQALDALATLLCRGAATGSSSRLSRSSARRWWALKAGRPPGRGGLRAGTHPRRRAPRQRAAVPVLLALGTIYEVRGEFGRAEEVAQAFLRQVPDAAPRRPARGGRLLACSLFHQGSFAHALEQAQRGVALFLARRATTTPSRLPWATTPASPAMRGRRSRCGSWGIRTRPSARRGSRGGLAGDPAAVVQLARARPSSRSSISAASSPKPPPSGLRRPSPPPPTAATRTASPWGDPAGLGTRCSGQFDEGIRELERGLLASRATGAHMDDAYYLGLLADARLRAGRLEAGLAAVEEALEIAHRERSFFCEAELCASVASCSSPPEGSGRDRGVLQAALELTAARARVRFELRIANCLTILRPATPRPAACSPRSTGRSPRASSCWPDLSRAAALLADAANRAAPRTCLLRRRCSRPRRQRPQGISSSATEALAVLVSARGRGSGPRPCGRRHRRAGDRQDLARHSSSVRALEAPLHGCSSAPATTS